MTRRASGLQETCSTYFCRCFWSKWRKKPREDWLACLCAHGMCSLKWRCGCSIGGESLSLYPLFVKLLCVRISA